MNNGFWKLVWEGCVSIIVCLVCLPFLSSYRLLPKGMAHILCHCQLWLSQFPCSLLFLVGLGHWSSSMPWTILPWTLSSFLFSHFDLCILALSIYPCILVTLRKSRIAANVTAALRWHTVPIETLPHWANLNDHCLFFFCLFILLGSASSRMGFG